MITPLRWVTGGGDQVKTTRLWSTSASNTSGEPEGAEEKVAMNISWYASSLATYLRGGLDDSLWW